MLFNVMSIKYKESLTKYNQLAYEADMISRTHESITEKISSIESQVSSKSTLTNNSAYQELVAYDNAYDVKEASLDTQMKTLQANIDAYKNALAKGAESRKWNCFG